MSEYLSCKACTQFAPNSANHRGSHPEYQAASSKNNSRFPKSLPPGTNFCTTFHAEKERLQESHQTTPGAEREQGIPQVSTTLSISVSGPPGLVQFLTGHDPSPCLKLEHPLCLLCLIFPSTYYHRTYSLLILLTVFFHPLDVPIWAASFKHLITNSIVPETRTQLSPQQELNKCFLTKCYDSFIIFKCILLPIIRIPPNP